MSIKRLLAQQHYPFRPSCQFKVNWLENQTRKLDVAAKADHKQHILLFLKEGNSQCLDIYTQPDQRESHNLDLR